MTRMSWVKWARASVLLCSAVAVAAQAQTFTSLASFDGTDGATPAAPLVQGTSGNLYGTTQTAGANCGTNEGCGTVFEITHAGVLTALHSFCDMPSCSDGAAPTAALEQATDGNFYGTTQDGGTRGQGVIFRLTPSGAMKTLYTFCEVRNCPNGASPGAGLIQASNGYLYGTTRGGGATLNNGEVFEVSPSGFRVLYSFCTQTNCSDGAEPFAPLIQAADGSLYGTTVGGGNPGCNGNCGTVYKLSLQGQLTTLYSFCSQANCADGANPLAGLVQANDGNFYGTTSNGGSSSQCGGGCGTIFKMTPTGNLTTLYSFCHDVGCPDGEFPYGNLVQATDGNLYGTTSRGGSNQWGTLFRISPDGNFTTLHNFCTQTNCTDGSQPLAGLIQATNGTLYGTTYGGGTGGYCTASFSGCGTVFSLNVGLGPFVTFLRNTAAVGQMFAIIGQGFSGTSTVSLNGTSVSFTVKSNTLIVVTVPVGATSGYVTVNTPGGTLTSNVPFQVIQ